MKHLLKWIPKGLVVLFFLSYFFSFSFAQAAPPPDITSFVREDCAHCRDQKEYFSEVLLKKQPDISIREIDIYTPEGKQLFDQFTDTYTLVKGTPITVVRGHIIQGFDSAQTTGKKIEQLLSITTSSAYSLEELIQNGQAFSTNAGSTGAVCPEENCEISWEDEAQSSYVITLPIIKKTIDVGGFSLAALSLILGFVDGFNPCAMWVLLMFIFALTQVGSRKKMVQFIGIFILAEAVMYYLILNVWLTAWDFISLNHIVTPLIGLLSIGSGIYFAYKFATFEPVCTVTNPEQKKKIHNKVQELAKKPMTLAVFLGILILAFSVNIFEFACSIGIPQSFTKILELNELSFLGTQSYMLLYIFMYMIDDLIVFGIALYAIEKIHSTQKYSKWATLLGAICMLLLGLLMLIKPELLVF